MAQSYTTTISCIIYSSIPNIPSYFMDTLQNSLLLLSQLSFEIKLLLIFVSFVYGAIAGSFLNVCIIRIPRGESIVTPPSHCTCGQPIHWYDNIPIISWILLGGKARCCKAKISFKYPLVEFGVACAWGMGTSAVLYVKYPWSFILACLLICGVPVITYYFLIKYKLFTEH